MCFGLMNTFYYFFFFYASLISNHVIKTLSLLNNTDHNNILKLQVYIVSTSAAVTIRHQRYR